MKELLFIAIVLACPLMMVLMMRGGHGHGGHAHRADREEESGAELRRERDELERLINQREAEENESTPVTTGR